MSLKINLQILNINFSTSSLLVNFVFFHVATWVKHLSSLSSSQISPSTGRFVDKRLIIVILVWYFGNNQSNLVNATLTIYVEIFCYAHHTIRENVLVRLKEGSQIFKLHTSFVKQLTDNFMALECHSLKDQHAIKDYHPGSHFGTVSESAGFGFQKKLSGLLSFEAGIPIKNELPRKLILFFGIGFVTIVNSKTILACINDLNLENAIPQHDWVTPGSKLEKAMAPCAFSWSLRLWFSVNLEGQTHSYLLEREDFVHVFLTPCNLYSFMHFNQPLWLEKPSKRHCTRRTRSSWISCWSVQCINALVNAGTV